MLQFPEGAGWGTVFLNTGMPINVPTDIYDLSVLSSTNNQPYYAAAYCTGSFREFSGINGTTFTVQISATPVVNRTFSNSGTFADNGRIFIHFNYAVTFISGGFDQTKLPTIAWALFKL